MSTARDQLRAIVTRIERLKEEQDAISGDIREVYAEAKASGYDKTALGQVVSIRRKKAKDPSGFEERSALVDLYLHALGDLGTEAATHAHTHERHDPETGEIAQDQDAARPAAAPATEPAARAADESPATNIAAIRPAEVIIREDRDAWDNRLRDFPDIPEELRRVPA